MINDRGFDSVQRSIAGDCSGDYRGLYESATQSVRHLYTPGGDGWQEQLVRCESRPEERQNATYREE
jgi:hypothetical protein